MGYYDSCREAERTTKLETEGKKWKDKFNNMSDEEVGFLMERLTDVLSTVWRQPQKRNIFESLEHLRKEVYFR